MTQLPAELLSWIAAATGASVTRAERVPGGGRRQAWSVDVDRDGSLEPLFLTFNSEEAQTPFTLDREAQFLSVMAPRGVPAPRVVAMHPQGRAMLCERVAGRVSLAGLDPADRPRVARSFMHAVAAVHALPATDVALTTEPLLPDLRAVARREIDRWEALYRGTVQADPLVEFGLRYLRENIPAAEGPVVIVHGDCGPGNFLHDGHRVTALLDWELAHFGDPMEDLAWISVRSVFDPLPDLAGGIAEYATRVDFTVDVDRIRYYRAFNELRVVILALLRAADPAAGEAATWLTLGPIHRRLCAEALAELSDMDVHPATAVGAPAPPLDWLYEKALADLRDVVVPQTSSSFGAARAKAVSRMIKYLRAAHRLQPALEAAERADLAALLGKPVDDLRQARRAIAETRAVSDRDLLTYFVRQAGRDCQLVEAAAGSMAARHFEPLPTTVDRR
ncbi:phosphotransferase family protein [Amycolatopsis sp. GM8]|uniref:phosphotransferase family protein n=1 Tax=Amycolatopsis sp. GM8 TaxID=2896530 RepID=UPI001F45DEB7|nr:phosphotransferase family protein [Amycolatopsis sp. GM8]